MSARLILAIVSTLLEEAALVAVVLVGLPHLGINIPLAGLIAMMVVWGAFSVFTYRAGSRALRRKPEIVLPLIGCKGKGEVISLEGRSPSKTPLFYYSRVRRGGR